jgi:hypothetical protein
MQIKCVSWSKKAQIMCYLVFFKLKKQRKKFKILTHIAAPSSKIKKNRQNSRKFSRKISNFIDRKSVNTLAKDTIDGYYRQ